MNIWVWWRLVLIREPSVVCLEYPKVFYDRFYWCMSWRGIRYCASTIGRMDALSKQEKEG